MASAAEQLAANLSWENFGRAKDLQQRILYTIMLLCVFRLGAYIPVPGVDGEAMQAFFQDFGAGLGDMVNMFTGGALQNAAIFSLGIMPYISASIIVQLLSATIPSLEALKKEGEPGRKKINQYTRYLTVVLATVQSYGFATLLESQGMAADPGMTFRLIAMTTWVAGTMFLMWLGEQITARGIGNGVSLIIFVGIVASLPRGVAQFFESTSAQGTSYLILVVLAMIVILVAFIVFVERSMRKIPVQYQRRQVGNKVYGGDSSHLPIKLNPAGVIPAIFASSVLIMPMTLMQSRMAGSGDTGVMGTVLAYIGFGQPGFYVLMALMLVFFTYFYTLNVAFKVDDVADNLKKSGGFVPGLRPGAKTAEFLEWVTMRILVAGSIYLIIVTVFPGLVQTAWGVPQVLQGTSLLIVVSVTLDTVGQIQSHLFAYQYEGLLEQSKLRGKDRAKARRKAPKRKRK